MSEKALLHAEDYNVTEQIERETGDAETGQNQQQEDAEGMKIEGLAIPFNKRSRNGVVYETESLKNAAETLVGCSILFNHDHDEPLGHVKDVEVTDEGIRYEGDLNPDRRETDSLKRGDIPNVSIQAMIEETQDEKADVAVTEFLELSAVTVPGFPQADVEAEGIAVESLVENKISSEQFEFEIGDFVRWEFASGSAEGEVIERTEEVGDSLSAGGNTFTVEDGDPPLYKMQEFDDEEGEFTNNVVKFEDELNSAERPDEAPATAPRNESVSKEQELPNFEFEPIPSLVLFDNEGDARERANDLGIQGIHQHSIDDQTYWMAGQTHGQWRQLVGAEESVEEDKSKEPFAGYDDFDDCVSQNQDKDDPEAYCAAIKRKVEKASEIRQVREALSDVDLTPPERVKNAAQAALEWEENNPDRKDCGTGVGDSRANSIIDETLSPEDFLGGDNTAIPDYLESHEEDVTAEGPPTDWSDEEMNDCGNRQYAKWGFYLEWFKEKEQELKDAKENVTMTDNQSTKEQLENVAEDDFMGTVADMYEELSASDAASLMDEFEFTGNPEPIIALVADIADMTPADLTDMLDEASEGTHDDDDEDDMEDEEGDMPDDDEDDEEEESTESESSNLNGDSQSGDNMTEKSRDELESKIEDMEAKIEKQAEMISELEDTEDSKQEGATSESSSGFNLKEGAKKRLSRQ